MQRNVDDATVLITGGTGSLGQTLVRRLLTGELGTPRRIIVFSRDEAKQYAMKTTWKHAYAATDDIYYHNFDELIEFWIGDVRDFDSVMSVTENADAVFHAAAMKQVPTCEYFPSQAVATNVLGAENVVRAARRSERTQSVNVMGMTKALQERIFVEGSLPLEGGTRMAAVRYGNVVSSRGSVIPLFRRQIESGGPVTITLPEMTRFLLSLDRAVDTIFTAYMEALPGEIFVPQCPAARIPDVAEAMIGERDIETIVTGIRPGEKVHEILVSEEEAHRTSERAGHYVIEPMLPELQHSTGSGPLTGEYSSADAIVTGSELTDLIAQADFVDSAMGDARVGP
jgi:UDP-glucose 4-epimerase